MVTIIVPVYNASAYLPQLLYSLQKQTLSHELIIIDSGSDQSTQEILAKSGARVIKIRKETFNHGSTRNLGVSLARYDNIIFLTQDALPASDDCVEILFNALNSGDGISMAYGRQIPYETTGVFGRYARLTNYPATSVNKDLTLIPTMGIRTCSCSNSFAAYKKYELLSVGGFPENTILGEDVSVAARLILKGKSLMYCADTQVYHSHDYTMIQEFKRYFDIGVFHDEQKEILSHFTEAESEGIKYVLAEYHFLVDNNYFHLIPSMVGRNVLKYVGYKLGRSNKALPSFIKKKISMHKDHWN